jgi:uncharacterized protein
MKFYLLLLLIVQIFFFTINSQECTKNYDSLPPSKSIKIGTSKIPNSGLGMFANENIRKGSIIEHCPLLFLKREFILKDSLLWKYLFKPSFKNQTFTTLAFGYCSIYNHHQHKVNVHHVQDCDRMMKIVAMKNIKKGQELYLDYGESYWNFHEDQKELLMIKW